MIEDGKITRKNRQLITLTYNLGNEPAAESYVAQLASELAPYIEMGCYIVIAVQEQPRGYSLADAIKTQLNEIDNFDGNPFQVNPVSSSFNTQTKPGKFGCVETSLLFQDINNEILTDQWQDSLNTNKGAASLTLDDLRISGVHLSSDDHQQRAREFYEIVKLNDDFSDFNELLQIADTYYNRVLLGDFNYRYMWDEPGVHPLLDQRDQTTLLSIMGFQPSPRDNLHNATTIPELSLDSMRNGRNETVGGYLDLAGSFENSNIVLDPARVLDIQDNASDHLPVLTTGVVNNDERDIHDKVKAMLRDELWYFVSEDVFNVIDAMSFDSTEEQDFVVILLNYVLALKDIWVKAELLRLGGDKDSFTKVTAVSSISDDELFAADSVLGQLSEVGNNIFRQGATDISSTVSKLRGRTSEIINSAPSVIQECSGFDYIRLKLTHFFGALKRYLGIKADTSLHQKREDLSNSMSLSRFNFFNRFTSQRDSESNSERLSM